MAFAFSDDEPSRRLGYAGNILDRRSEHRGDGAWVAAALARDDARIHLFADDRVILRPGEPQGSVTHSLALARELGADDDAMILLGFEGEAPRFAASTGATADSLAPAGLELIDLRSLALRRLVPAAEIGAIAQARSLLGWHATHGFCSRCGARSIVAAAGYRRDCPSCSAQHFPRTDPVVIMLTTHGDDCLLGRQRRFATGMYSCLAGFVEPGETIEDAVRRETFEEAGIRVGRVAYVASQPWPFVSSLMIGCRAEALSTEITMDEAELEACRWFPRAEVRQMLAATHPDGLLAPAPIAIARELIRLWAEE